MIKANYHTHLVYCNHAKGHAKDYIEVAIEAGFEELGISDHAPVLECFFDNQNDQEMYCKKTCNLDKMFDYLRELKDAKEKYKKQIRVLSAFEVEYLPSNEFFIKHISKKVDYLNLGIHYFYHKGKIINTYEAMTKEELFGYAKACVDGMITGWFKCLVHPDLYTIGYYEAGYEFDEYCEQIARQIIESAIENNVYLEVNANGIRNSKRIRSDGVWLYPHREFWKIAKEYPELKIVIGTDAHVPEALVNQNVEDAISFVKELGLVVSEKIKF